MGRAPEVAARVGLDLPLSRGELSGVRAASEKSYTLSRSRAVRQMYLRPPF